MKEPRQIIDLDDVKLLVDSFYGKVRQDELLAPVFNARIGDAWPQHLHKMYRFWQTILLEEQTYFGSPFVPHANLPVGKEHFNRWMALFNETVTENFSGEKAEEARWRAQKMAEMFLYKIEYFRNNPEKPIL